jgi:hypothetical protein
MAKRKSLKGTSVRWTSQGRGTWNDKEGVIVEVVPRDQLPTSNVRLGSTKPRDHESYIVKTKDGKFYWPRISALQFVTSQV